MIGKTLGHYQITEKLGAGGMGVVYETQSFSADPAQKRRFVQEATAASDLNHPDIIGTYNIDQAEDPVSNTAECSAVEAAALPQGSLAL